MKHITTSFCLLLFILFSHTAFAGGCDVNASITVNGPTTICSNDSVELIANPGVSYLWTNGATTQSIWVNQPGPNRVNVTDSNGCSDNSNFVFINVIPAPEASILSDQLPPYCMGDTVTLFTLNLPFYDFEWTTGETTPFIEITQSGLYGVTVTNISGCSDTAQFPAAFLPAPFLSVTADGPLTFCEGQDVKISVNFGFGLDFLWAPNGETGSNITVDESGTYNVTATNFFGCSSTSQNFEVNVVPIPTAFAEKDTMLCSPDTITLTATGGSSYSWSDGSTGSVISVVPDFGDSQYIVTVSNAGCNVTAKDTVFVHVGGDVVADFLVTAALLGEETSFTDLSTGSIATWNWNFDNGQFSFVQNPTTVYLEEDTFTVTLIVADQYGCSDTAQQNFFIEQVVTVPNVFTPNGDDYNDSFYISNKGDGGFVFTVINRWGQVVFNTEGQEVRWSGLSNAGVELPSGTYYYVLSVDLKEGEEPVVQKGFITLIKG